MNNNVVEKIELFIACYILHLMSSQTDTMVSPYPEKKQFSWLLDFVEKPEQSIFSEALNLCKNKDNSNIQSSFFSNISARLIFCFNSVFYIKMGPIIIFVGKKVVLEVCHTLLRNRQ